MHLILFIIIQYTNSCSNVSTILK